MTNILPHPLNELSGRDLRSSVNTALQALVRNDSDAVPGAPWPYALDSGGPTGLRVRRQDGSWVNVPTSASVPSQISRTAAYNALVANPGAFQGPDTSRTDDNDAQTVTLSKSTGTDVADTVQVRSANVVRNGASVVLSSPFVFPKLGSSWGLYSISVQIGNSSSSSVISGMFTGDFLGVIGQSKARSEPTSTYGSPVAGEWAVLDTRQGASYVYVAPNRLAWHGSYAGNVVQPMVVTLSRV